MTTFGGLLKHLGGVPVNAQMPFITGNVYFVSSVVGSSAGDGSKDFPYNTLLRALAFSTKNDCIILMPGHAETLNATNTFLLSTNYDGITIWGVGHYDAQPLFTYGTTDSSAYAKIQAANVRIHNVHFLAGSTKQRTCAIKVEAKGCWLDNIYIEDVDASTMDFATAILCDATNNVCDGFTLTNSVLYCESSLSQVGVNMGAANRDWTIKHNRFIGHWATGGLAAVYAASTVAQENFEVSHNVFNHLNDQSDDCRSVYILGDGSRGVIAYNVAGMVGATGSSLSFRGSGTGTICIAENYITTAANKSGMLTPVADATA